MGVGAGTQPRGGRHARAWLCALDSRTLRLNTELAKKPKACLEYIVVHEMCHLLDPMHGPSFLALLDRFLPAWRETRSLLNRLPARHERWNY